ncbi:uncharacterized protein [Henckelia pumila]|uniref:uncharacterized protein n=1 Tax=Henckelia pumila TaxID=405737 RepID=UPI003C6E6F0D
MISGGSTDGDSNRARKSWTRRESLGVEEGKPGAGPAITFGPRDLEGVNLPHNDALLIQARIANYDVRRVFVDSGSSVNVLFQDAFEQMDLQGYELSPVKTALYGFAGHTVQPQGEMLLPITLGAGDVKKTIMTKFTLVEAPSSCNVILGRPAMNALRAVASAYHQKIKFPVGDKVGEVRGDQPSSQKCYAETVRVDYKRARQIGKEGGGQGGREVCSVEESKGEYEEVELVLGQSGKFARIARNMETNLAESLKSCLIRNKDIFSWVQGDLIGVSSHVAEHKLNITPGSRLVIQKKRHFGAEKDKVIAEQVQELLWAGHIKEVQFPTWLSNVVLVPKATGKWRMCVDFWDLNKAYSKDCYPLPRIDQLVDFTSGCELLCFMDAYQGYHQIPLARKDQYKVSFITSEGTFCYVVMPFGLKNAGATYQRMMDKVFREQVGRNVEVYVDDILVKSKTRDCFIPDLEETFATVRRYGIKLNPVKCMFRVKSGKFLGFMVTERGIEVNPEKVKLLQEIPSPTSIKEVHRLTGRITALARFIAQSAHRSYPFFQVLRTAQRFGWTEQCEQSFQELKEHLASLPILVKLEPGEKLWVYLSTTERAVSTVLIKEERGYQRPVYYVSHALKGAEVRYAEIEKMTLALVITARKLRPYFLSHPITVLTNSLLGRILTHPDASGRLVKWSVELGEYDIEYQPRKAIKAQALSDFLTEVATFGQEEVWRIFVDGASGVGGSGVGVILVSPTQEKIKIAMRLDFQASNNEAKYEAVIAGMRQAREVGVSHIIIYSDSQLVVQQVKRIFCTREEKLIKYSKVIEELGASFITWTIEQIPREENMEADALAKRAVTGENGDKESLVQREMVATIESREPVIREDTWMIPLVRYLTNGDLPADKGQAQVIRRQIARFSILGGRLYRRSYQGPLLKCLGEGETEYVLREVHEGCRGNHGGSMSLARRAARPRLSHDEDVAERFQKKGPKEFSGVTDPLVAEGWIRYLENIFAYMGLTDADKIKCAVYMMKDDAALWWEGAVRGVNPQTLTWEEFKRMFFAKYFTEDVRSRMIREFMSLRQGDKTVVEYIKQFERGCHFVPLIADNAQEKMRQFVDGLRADIKHDVRMMDVTTYEAAVSRALRSEDGRKEILREQRGRGNSNHRTTSRIHSKMQRSRPLGRQRAQIH